MLPVWSLPKTTCMSQKTEWAVDGWVHITLVILRKFKWEALHLHQILNTFSSKKLFTLRLFCLTSKWTYAICCVVCLIWWYLSNHRSDFDVGQLHAKYRKFTNLNSAIKTGCIDSGLNKPAICNPSLAFSKLVSTTVKFYLKTIEVYTCHHLGC